MSEQAEVANPGTSRAERMDFSEFGRANRPQPQGLEGFDPDYADIVDYIVRCTHRIWEERDVGLIYSHYTHNCVVHSALGTTYDREDVVEATIQRIVTMPDRGMADQVIWRGNDQTGFYTSHLVTTAGRHTQPGPYGPATGLAFATRTIADCMIWRNRIHCEWLVGDSMAVVRQLGLDPEPIAEARAEAMMAKGQQVADLGISARLLGQRPPGEGDVARLAHDEVEAWALRLFHEGLNRRLLGRLQAAYAPEAPWHGPQMAELAGGHAASAQWMSLLAAIPDAAWLPQHTCSVAQEQGTKVALRWIIEGHHRGWGLASLGPPTGAPVRLMGMTHLHVVDERIVEEWTVWDEMALLVQVRLAGMARDG